MAKKVIVIGSGLGGLSAAIRLANAGFNVEVYEQSHKPGGKANEINEMGFRFDTGPSLVTMPFIIEQLFDDVGERIEEYLDLIPLKTLCRYFWNDGVVINAYSDIEKFSDEVENKTTEQAKTIINYLDYSKKIYELTADLFLFGNFSEWKDFMNIRAFKTLAQIWKIDPFRTMHKANGGFFKEAKLVQLFDRYATYNGSNPFQAPATLNIIPYVEYKLGGFVPAKGIYSIVDSLYKLAVKKGVRFNFDSRVISIKKTGNAVNGIIYSNMNLEREALAEIVVSNADVNFTYKKLLRTPQLSSAVRYQKTEPSSSAIVFYWGVKGNYPRLEIHNILFSKDYKKEFEDLFVRNKHTDDPTVYIYISSKFNEADAPNGFENWFVMINVPHASKNTTTDAISKMKEIILRKINSILGIDLKDKIVFEQTMTPEDIEKNTSSYLGSLYGISSNNRGAAFKRQTNRSKDFRGLYFCGGSAHPGGGIPLVILSGKNAAKQIMKNEN